MELLFHSLVCMAVNKLVVLGMVMLSIVYLNLLISLTCTDFWQRIVVIFLRKVSKSSVVSKDIGALVIGLHIITR